MMRSLLIALVATLSFTLSACGLTPVYGTNADGQPAIAKALDSVYIDIIPDRTGQMLRNKLLDRMVKTGTKTLATAPYRLKITNLTESIYSIGIAKDDSATRSQIKLRATLTLLDNTDAAAKPLLTRKLQSVASFNQLSSQYTTLVSKEDARIQTINGLADRIITQLELYFSNPQAFVKDE